MGAISVYYKLPGANSSTEIAVLDGTSISDFLSSSVGINIDFENHDVTVNGMSITENDMDRELNDNDTVIVTQSKHKNG